MKELNYFLFISFLTIVFNPVNAQQRTCVSGNCQNGYGILTTPNGTKYEGNFSEGKLSGQGTLYMPNNDKYVGEFSQDLINGKGIYYFANGFRYEGTFTNGQLTGTGTFYNPNGDKYVGDIVQGAMQGNGTYYYASGAKAEGKFDKNKYLGSGRFDINEKKIIISNSIKCADISYDGNEVTYSTNDSINILNIQSGKNKSIFEKNSIKIANSFDDKIIYSLGKDYKLRAYDRNSGKLLKTCFGTDTILQFAISPKSNQAVILKKEVFYLIDLTTCKIIDPFNPVLNKVRKTEIETLSSGAELIKSRKYPEFIIDNSLSFTPDGKNIVYSTCNINGEDEVKIPKTKNIHFISIDKTTRKTINTEFFIMSYAIAPANDYIVIADLESISIWRIEDGKKIKVIKLISEIKQAEKDKISSVNAIIISPDQTKLILNCSKISPFEGFIVDFHKLFVFDLNEGSIIKETPEVMNAFCFFALSKDGSKIIGTNNSFLLGANNSVFKSAYIITYSITW